MSLTGIGEAANIAGQGLMQWGQMQFQKDMKDEEYARLETIAQKKAASLASTRQDFSKTKEGMQFAHDLEMGSKAVEDYRRLDTEYNESVSKIRQSADLGPEDKDAQIAKLNDQYKINKEGYQKLYKGNNTTKGHVENPRELHSGQFATADDFLNWGREVSPGKSDQQLIEYAKSKGITIDDWQSHAQTDQPITSATPTGTPGDDDVKSLASGVPKAPGNNTVQNRKGHGQMNRRLRRPNQQEEKADNPQMLIAKRKEMLKAMQSKGIPDHAKAGIRRKLKLITERLATLGYDQSGNQVATN